MRKVASVFVAILVAIAVLPMTGSAQPREVRASGSDVRHFVPRHRELVTTKADVREARSLAARNAAPPEVGEERLWIAYDDVNGLYVKEYTLRGIGEHIEVWVASDEDDISAGLDFPAGDCRNDGVRNVISDEDVDYLIDQFDNVMYPAESETFSVPPTRDGSNAPLAEILGLPKNYYKGDGDRIVTLIDNVRDENFFDTNNENGFTYTAGFYWNLFDDYTNRLMMTIDSFDWLHRTGDNPPNEPVPGDNCANANARPNLYEGVFAHEYQHLLMNYVDFDEVSWVNEGISDWAQTLVGYVDGTLGTNTIGFDNHIQCFLGYYAYETPANPLPRPGGPEQSLTRWGDQTDYEQEILCDYGAAYTFMLYLADRFGDAFMSAFHLDDANGLDSLSHLLKDEDPTLTPGTVIGRWALAMAIDSVLDAGWTLMGDADPAQIQVSTLNASINWINDQAYAAPGAPANGSDYVRLRDETDAFLSVDELTSIEFDGASELPPLPLEWEADKNSPKHGGKALFSQAGDNLDHSMAFETKIKEGQSKLSFDTFYKTEPGYDWFYVQVSNNGGKSFKSVKCSGTNVNGALGPAFEGNSGGWVHESCNLKRFAGEKVIISFRYVTDGGVAFAGVWVDNVEVGNKLISDGSLKPFDSPTQINATDVQQFIVQLVAFDEGGHVVHVYNLPLDENFDGSLSDTALTDALGTAGSTVAAIVTYLDRTEEVQQQAPYTLTVNGVVQPGGA